MQSVSLLVTVLLFFSSSILARTVRSIQGKGKSMESMVSEMIDEIEHESNPLNNLPGELKEEFLNSSVNLRKKYTDLPMNFTIQYLLFTPVNQKEAFDLQPSQDSLNNSTFDPSLETKFLIHGFNVELTKTAAMFDIKNQLLQKGDYNVIVVNWTKYNGPPYAEASLNAVYVGFEIAKLVQLFMDFLGISSKSVHIIGHSLGAQIAGFTGKFIANLGRISGVDAAGPLFQDLPSNLRLTHKDAEFVDALHTNGAQFVWEGYGTLLPYGHLDFFPNGGSVQPGCSTGDTYVDTNKKPETVDNLSHSISCNHDRALYLYMESINRCQFLAVQCHSYPDFKDGKCLKQKSLMGFHAKPIPFLPTKSKFYLETSGKSPYCMKSS